MALYYHGTTRSRARLIRQQGFSPKPPSRRVWFTLHRGLAERRARHKASRAASDRPIVLACEIDVDVLTRLVGTGRIFCAKGLLSVRGALPPQVLRDDPQEARHSGPYQAVPDDAAGLARWLNRLLNLHPHKGVSRKHPGVQRLCLWVRNRMAQNVNADISQTQVAELAGRWLPELFEGVAIDHQRMRSLRFRGSATGDLSALLPHEPDEAADADDADQNLETEALACLAADKPRRRIRGLELLSSIESPADLVEWCLLLVDDESVDVSVAALETLATRCDNVNPFLVEDLAADSDRRLRAAALEVLALHDDTDTRRWIREGLTDPEPHVRMRLVRHLERLEPAANADVYETALTDPNPEIVRLAQRRSAGQGIGIPTW